MGKNKGSGDSARNWQQRGDWGSSNGGWASDNERRGGCPLSLLILPFQLIRLGLRKLVNR